MGDLFVPDAAWQPVSPRLATALRLTWLPAVVVATVALAVLWSLALPKAAVVVPVVLLLGAVAAVAVWGWAGRRQRSWAYAENDHDLYVTHGVMVRRLVAVPYGRTQYVDVEAGPVARRLGLATVTVHTANPRTAAGIPGLPHEVATALRDRLTERGDPDDTGV